MLSITVLRAAKDLWNDDLLIYEDNWFIVDSIVIDAKTGRIHLSICRGTNRITEIIKIQLFPDDLIPVKLFATNN